MDQHVSRQLKFLIERANSSATEFIAELETEDEKKIAEIVKEIYEYELKNFLEVYGREV